MGDSSGFSRRSFLGGTGSAATALAALGSGLLGVTAGTAQAALNQRQYSSVALGLEIEGEFAGLLSNASGGGPVVQMVTSPISASSQSAASPDSIRQEPVTISFTSGMSARALEWFDAMDLQPRNAAIVMFDPVGGTELYRLSLRDTLVTGVSMSTLDGSKTDPVEFSVTLEAAQSTHEMTARKSMSGTIKARQSVMRVNAFRFFVDKLEKPLERTRSLKGIAITRRTPVAGAAGRGGSQPGTRQFSNIEATVSLDSAGPLYQWLGDALSRRNAQRPGQLQLLGQDGRALVYIDFPTLLPLLVSTPFAAADDNIPGVKVEMSPSDIRLNLRSLAA